MDMGLIMNGEATLEDLCELNERKGVRFVIEDGQVTEVIL